MEYTDLELELVKKYMSGEYNDIQFNYWSVYYNLDKKKLYRIREYLVSVEPLARVSKFILILIMVHFLFCFFYSISCYLN